MDALHWTLTICIGLGLAASTGFNATLPLLILSALSRFHVGGMTLRGDFSWLSSDTAIISLSVAALVEFVADKIPAVDHAVHAIRMVAGPIAGAIAASSVQIHVDRDTAILIGLIVGGTTSLGFTGAVASLRMASSALTLGTANPFLSLAEDFTSIGLLWIALVVPIFVPGILGILILIVLKAAKSMRSRTGLKKVSGFGRDAIRRLMK